MKLTMNEIYESVSSADEAFWIQVQWHNIFNLRVQVQMYCKFKHMVMDMSNIIFGGSDCEAFNEAYFKVFNNILIARSSNLTSPSFNL